jgi:hypothetical protein
LAGISAGQFNIHFPRRFTGVLKFLRLLPIRCWFAVIRRTTGM